jgi:hypothetical protein
MAQIVNIVPVTGTLRVMSLLLYSSKNCTEPGTSYGSVDCYQVLLYINNGGSRLLLYFYFLQFELQSGNSSVRVLCVYIEYYCTTL